MKKTLESMTNFPSLQSISKLVKNKIVQYAVPVLLTIPLLTSCGGKGGNDSQNNPPVVYDIADQTINKCESFVPVDLTSNVSDESPSTVTWQVEGNTSLNVTLENGYLNVSVPDCEWTGSEVLKVRATDDKGQSNEDSVDNITFTALEVINQNTSPYVTSSNLPIEVNENSNYVGEINAVDSDGDNMSCDFWGQAPVFMNLSGSMNQINGEFTCSVTGVAIDADAEQNHQATIRIDDGKGGSVDTPINVYVNNTESAHFKIGAYDSDFDSSNDLNLDGIRTRIHNDMNSYECVTNSLAGCTIENVLDGTYNITFKDENGVYQTYKTGGLVVNNAEAQNGNLDGLERRLYEKVDQGFVNDVARGTGVPGKLSPNGIEKWETYKPVWDIYTVEGIYEIPVDPTKIDMVKDLLKNEIAEFYQQPITDADINVINTKNQASQNGHVNIFWNADLPGGVNREYFNGSDVVSGYASCSLSQWKSTWIQELFEVLIGGGESNIYPSISNDPSDYPVDYTILQPKDKLISNMVYGPHSREAGNKDFSSTKGSDYGDVDKSYNFTWDN